MANLPKKLFRGAASTSNTTLYTAPSNTTTVVTNIVVCNTSASSQTFTINLSDVSMSSSTTIAANSIATFNIKQIIDSSETITGSASATSVNFHISGVEIS